MSTENNDNEERELPALSGDLREDVNRARGEGFLEDDDDEPVVENIPATQSNNEECVCVIWSGNAPGFCTRKSSGRRK